MGAATAIFTMAKKQDIAAAILDSPFSRLKDAINSIAREYHVSFLIGNGFEGKLKNISLSKIGFDITTVNPINVIDQCFTPAFFIHAEEDTTIPLENSIELFDKYPGLKQISVIKGNHYTDRPFYIISEGITFLCNSVGLTIEFQ